MLKGCAKPEHHTGTNINGIKLDDGNVIWKQRKSGFASMTARNHGHARACQLENPIRVKKVPCMNTKAFEEKSCGAERAVWRDLKRFIDDVWCALGVALSDAAHSFDSGKWGVRRC